MKKYIIGITLLGSLLSLGSCKDDFAERNTDPSIISEPDMKFLFTHGLTEFRPSDYYAWFYDFSAMSRWAQATVRGGGNENLLNSPSNASGNGNIIRVMRVTREMDFQLSKMDDKTSARYRHMRAILTPLLVYMGIQDTDMYGSMPYTEAGLARYTEPVLLTPKYDTQQELLTSTFLKELDEAIKVLTTIKGAPDAGTLVPLGSQDFIYKGDIEKWAKFCNSLKLKIAVRLLHVNKAKAFEIVKEVMASPAGLILDYQDDFIYNQGSEWYNSLEDPTAEYGNKTLIDFLVDNKDPRVRFFFAKNDFNSKVVQAFFDAKAENSTNPDLPSYIADKVESEVVNGKKVFKGWKAPGEPWIRYHGLPSKIDAASDKNWEEYFNPSGKLFTIKLGGKEKSYTAMASLQYEMYEGVRDYTFPDAPGVAVTQDTDDRPYYGLYFTSSEVNLYLAELKLLGAPDITGSAADYLKAGVENSVRAWDKVAGLNKIPYYGRTFDSNEKTIDLIAGEVEALLDQAAYKLTGGADDLEKVYIQQRLNFIFMPQELYVSTRRSGIPMRNSAYLPFEEFTSGNYLLPRRQMFSAPSPSDKMHDIIVKAREDQGFSVGSNPSQLNTQRVWYDKGAPNIGEGPNLKK